ncbi:MAG: hypothetical protein UT94_C0024G0008 [Candidatus Uhrbacteria bacterium GW2011_GWF2_40_263]|nr:MAG: hypothetical protein UT94_C0024G0008 [Candidatus Uhrbacteria bacterium GW2011_GWF2_40_263]
MSKEDLLERYQGFVVKHLGRPSIDDTTNFILSEKLKSKLRGWNKGEKLVYAKWAVKETDWRDEDIERDNKRIGTLEKEYDELTKLNNK